MHPIEGESFIQSIDRMVSIIGKMSAQDRLEMINKVDRKNFYEAIGIKTRETVTHDEIRANAEALGQQLRDAVTQDQAPSREMKESFYRSWEWRTVRMEFIKDRHRRCGCCGSTPDMLDLSGNPVRIVVDHIKPISSSWHLRMEKTNLQILCDECNQGKGGWDESDYRLP